MWFVYSKQNIASATSPKHRKQSLERFDTAAGPVCLFTKFSTF